MSDDSPDGGSDRGSSSDDEETVDDAPDTDVEAADEARSFDLSDLDDAQADTLEPRPGVSDDSTPFEFPESDDSDAVADSEVDPADPDEPLGGLARRLADRRDGAARSSGTHPDADPDPPVNGDVAEVDAAGADAEVNVAGADAEVDADPDELLGGLASRVRDSRAAGDAEDAETEGLFDRMETAELDPEEVWEQITDDDVDEMDVGSGDAVRVEREDPAAMRADHVVPKAEYCESCQYFSSPPTVACTHEETEIVEVVDSKRFRVRGCPMIEGVAAFGTVRGRGGNALDGNAGGDTDTDADVLE